MQTENRKEFENDIKNAGGGAYFTIPAHVIENKNIDFSEMILYAHISNLSNKKGHCWAKDQYLADLMGVSIQELKSKLKKLEDENLIYRVTQKNGFLWDRKIYTDLFYLKEKSLQEREVKEKNTTSFTTDVEVSTQRSASIYKKQLSKKQGLCAEGSSRSHQAREKTLSSFEGEKFVVTKDKMIEHAVLANRDWTAEEMNEAWEVVLARQQPVADFFALIEGIINNLRIRKQRREFLATREKKEKKECKTQLKTKENDSSSNAKPRFWGTSTDKSLLEMLEEMPDKNTEKS
jgi:hypothetical protein